MTTLRQRGATGALALTLILLAANSAGAQERRKRDNDDDKKKPRAAEKVEVQVLVIRATTANSDVDDDLKDIAEQLRKSGRYTGFKVEKRLKKTVEVGKGGDFDLGHDFDATVTPQKREGERVTLRVESSRTRDGKKKPHAPVTFTQDRGKWQPMGGWKIDDGGDAMILAVSGK